MKKITLEYPVNWENECYFVPQNYGALIHKDDKNTLEVVEYFCKKDGNVLISSYLNTFNYDNKIFMIPYHSDSIRIFDIRTKKMDVRILPEKERSTIGYSFFEDAFVFEESIYAIGSSYSGILRIDMKTLEMEIIDNWIDEYKELAGNNVKIWFRQARFINNSELMLGCYLIPGVLIYNLKNKTYRIQHINGCTDGIILIQKVNENYVIVDKKGNAVLWDSINHSTERIYNSEDNQTEKKALLIGKMLYIFTCNNTNTIIINIDTYDVVVDNSLAEVVVPEKLRIRFVYLNDNGEIILACWDAMFKLNLNTRRWEKLTIVGPQIDFSKYINDCQTEIIHENEALGAGINEYIQFVMGLDV